MSLSNRRFLLLAITLIATGAVLGGSFGGKLQADPVKTEDQLWTFGSILATIEDEYAGDANSTEMVEDAIAGMLRRLDPHSNYLGPDSFSEMRDEQRGKFHGLGIQITKRGPDKPLTIIAPIDDTPASRAGLQSGDIISHIEGSPTIDLTVQEAVSQLKGDKGTQVTVTIVRPGAMDPFDVTLERDEIPIESIRVAYMLDDETGFIRIFNFTSTTSDELDAAMAVLKEKGMQRLILDLRGNPGGLLDQAVQVSERFIDSNKLVVYTRGRIPGSNQDFVAKRGVERTELPLVVLLDGSSASASEIVSGAVQDHDRGILVGETTFGKGLVQRVIPLQNDGALAVTTAKYYTPSGRLIQRDYSDLERYYFDRGSEDEPTEEPDPTDDPLTEEEVEAADVFYTASGRKVFGGGGIRPDYEVESPRAPQILLRLVRDNLIFDYAVQYVADSEEIDAKVTLKDGTMVDFRNFVEQREFKYEPNDWDEAARTIETRLRSQIARVRWDQIAEARILAEADPQIQKALEVFDEAAELQRRGKDGDPTKQSDLRAEAREKERSVDLEPPANVR